MAYSGLRIYTLLVESFGDPPTNLGLTVNNLDATVIAEPQKHMQVANLLVEVIADAQLGGPMGQPIVLNIT